MKYLSDFEWVGIRAGFGCVEVPAISVSDGMKLVRPSSKTELAKKMRYVARTLAIAAIVFSSLVPFAAIANSGDPAPPIYVKTIAPEPSVVGSQYLIKAQLGIPGQVPPLPSPTVTRVMISSPPDGECSTVTSSRGGSSCTLIGASSGIRSVTATAYGTDGSQFTSKTVYHVITDPLLTTPHLRIISDAHDSSAPNETYTVSVSLYTDSGPLDGTVKIQSTAETCDQPTITVVNGFGKCDVTPNVNQGFQVGERTLTALYSGSQGINPASATESHFISDSSKTDTILTLYDPKNPSDVGVAYDMDFKLTDSLGQPLSGKGIDLRDEQGLLYCESWTGSDGSSVCSISDAKLLTFGIKHLKAVFHGDDIYNGVDISATHIVRLTSLLDPIITLNVHPDVTAYGAAYDAAVSLREPTGAPLVGWVNVINHGDDAKNKPSQCSNGIPIRVNGGDAICSIANDDIGNNRLEACFDGDEEHNPACANETHLVTDSTRSLAELIITSDAPDPSSIDPLASDHAYTVAVSLKSATSPFPGISGTVRLDTYDVGGPGCENNIITVTNGTGSCQVKSDITAGSKTLTATFAGDGRYGPTKDEEWHVTADPALQTPTLEIVGSDPNPSDVGDQNEYSVSVRLSATSGNPTGAIIISDDRGNSCPVIWSAPPPANFMSCTLPGSPTGRVVPLMANYAGQPGSFNAASATASHIILDPSKTRTVTTILSDTPDSSPVNTAYLVTVDVSSVTGQPTGTVLISDGLSSRCSASLDSQGHASCPLASGPTPGVRTITAVYQGLGTYNPSMDTEQHVVGSGSKTNTVITIVSDNPDPSNSNESYDIVVSLRDVNGINVANTTARVYSPETGVGCPVVLINSIAVGVCTIPNDSTVRVHTLVAVFDGDDLHNGSYAETTHIVRDPSRRDTTLALSDSPDPSAINAPYTVSVSAAASGITPAGDVIVSDGKTDVCAIALSGGRGSCQITPNATGVFTLQARYNGSSSPLPGTNPAIATAFHTVNDPSRDATYIDLFDASGPTTAGNTYTFNFYLRRRDGTPVVGAVVALKNVAGNGPDCTNIPTTNVDGFGSCDVNGDNNAGIKPVCAIYMGGAAPPTNGSTSCVDHVVTDRIGGSRLPTTTTIGVPPISAFGNETTVTVTVSDQFSGTPIGLITVMDDQGISCAFWYNTQTSCNLPAPTSGPRTICASYGGSSNHQPSKSCANNEVVTDSLIPTQLSIDTITPEPSAVLTGRYTVTVSLTSTPGGASGLITVSDGEHECAFLYPNASSCELLPASVVGTRTVTATYKSNATYLGSLATKSHRVAYPLDLASGVMNGLCRIDVPSPAVPTTVTYTGMVHNYGPFPATAARIGIASSTQLSIGVVSWQCNASGGAKCANGSDNQSGGAGQGLPPSYNTNIPVGGEVLFQVTVKIPALPEEEASLTISADVGPTDMDIMPSNNADTDRDPVGIFGNGFDLDGDCSLTD